MSDADAFVPKTNICLAGKGAVPGPCFPRRAGLLDVCFLMLIIEVVC